MVVGFRLIEESRGRKSRSKGSNRYEEGVRWFWLKIE